MVHASVIIPTYNRSTLLRNCLQSLCEQTQPAQDFEVVVVVDGSTDGTLQMLEGLSVPYRLRVIYQANQGQAAALNRGAVAAEGHVLIFIDDDLLASSDLIAGHLSLHGERSNAIGVGQIKLTAPNGGDWFTKHYVRDWDSHYRRLNGGRPPGWEDCYGGNMSVPKAVYDEIGGNDATLARSFDVDLAYRLECTGMDFVYLPKALGTIIEPKGFREIAADLEKNGAHYVELCRRYPTMLPHLIGFYLDYKWSWTFLWRLLLRLGITPHTLERASRLFGRRAGSPNLYRFLERYCFWRGVRQASPDPSFWNSLTSGTPILMYHAFGSPGEPSSRYVTPLRSFARQMAWLHRMGYHVLSLEEYLDYRARYEFPPERSVVITIDDGYQDNKTLAYPVLRRYGFPATIFLVTGLIGKTYFTEVESELNSRPMLSWQDIQEMAQGGIHFGAHTRTHPDLLTLTAEQVCEELSDSRYDIENTLGIPVQTFSYPFGSYHSSLHPLVEQAGFLGSCSIDEGLNTPTTDLFALRRVEIYGTDSLFDFALAVRFGERREAVWKRITILYSQLSGRGGILNKEAAEV